MSTSTESTESAEGAKITPSQTAIEIPSSVATHVLSESEAVLGEGTLTVVVVQPPAHTGSPRPPFHGTNDMPVIMLSVGKAAFPLFKTTLFGTLADDERVYLFAPEMGGHMSGYGKITLPEGVTEPGSELAQLQAKFEQVLIDQGLLKEGMAAGADELGKSVRYDSATFAQRLRERTALFLSRNPPANEPAAEAPDAQSMASASASGTQSMATKARSFSTAVSSAASQAGTWFADHLIPTTSTQTEKLASLSAAPDSVADGVAGASAGGNAALEDGSGTSDGAHSMSAAGTIAAPATTGQTVVNGPDSGSPAFSLDDEEAWKDVSI